MMDERELEDLRITESKSLLSHLVAQRGRLTGLVARALEATDYRTATSAENAIGSNLERTGKLLGEFGEATRNVVNNTLIVSDQYLTLRRLLIEALRPAEFKAARLAVAKALSAVESGTANSLALPDSEAPGIAEIEPRSQRTLGIEPQAATDRPGLRTVHGSAVKAGEGPFLPARPDDVGHVVASVEAAESALLEAPGVTPEPSSTVITLVR